MKDCTYPFFVHQFVFSFLYGFWYVIAVKKATFNLETNTIFGIFLHFFKSFPSGEYYTAYPFVTDISGIILPTPVHTYFYFIHNTFYFNCLFPACLHKILFK